MEVLITLLMFAFPIALAILDKRARRKKGRPQVKAYPVFPPEEPDDDLEEAPFAREEDVSAPVWQEQETPVTPVSGDAAEEGQRSLGGRSANAAPKEEKHGKLEIDKKKLILYSEILKPKFDE